MKRADVIDRITRSHIEKAINQIDAQNWVPERRNSRKYSLHYEGHDYPPKYLIMLAGKYATGKTLTPEDHSGGKHDSNRVLLNLGFNERDALPLRHVVWTAEKIRLCFPRNPRKMPSFPQFSV